MKPSPLERDQRPYARPTDELRGLALVAHIEARLAAAEAQPPDPERSGER